MSYPRPTFALGNLALSSLQILSRVVWSRRIFWFFNSKCFFFFPTLHSLTCVVRLPPDNQIWQLKMLRLYVYIYIEFPLRPPFIDHFPTKTSIANHSYIMFPSKPRFYTSCSMKTSIDNHFYIIFPIKTSIDNHVYIIFPIKTSIYMTPIAIFTSLRATNSTSSPARLRQRSRCCRAPRGSFDRPAVAAGLCLQWYHIYYVYELFLYTMFTYNRYIYKYDVSIVIH